MTDEAARRFTAVLADDVPNLRVMFRMALELSGRFDVVAEAGTGEETIELTGRHRPDLVLLDVSMPGLDGLQALPRVLEASPESSVVILSGFEADRLAPLALQLGAKAYLEKGIRPDALVATLVNVLDGSEEVEVAPAPLPTDHAVSPDELLSFVAHEIRNPLAILQGFGTTLESHWDDFDEEKRRDIVHRMLEGARYLDGIVTSVLYLRSLETGHLSVSREIVDATAALEDMADHLKRCVDKRELLMSIEEGLPRVNIDSARLRQVLTNLIVNADKYSPAGTDINLSARAEGARLVIRIADLGPGIPASERDHVFEKFARLQRSGKGLGLGLYISRALVQAMGGAIAIEDVPAGTTVAVRFPAVA